ncbi:MAG: hypothetical protein ACTSUE_09130 [Promethearchaeota archaeon]
MGVLYNSLRDESTCGGWILIVALILGVLITVFGSLGWIATENCNAARDYNGVDQTNEPSPSTCYTKDTNTSVWEYDPTHLDHFLRDDWTELSSHFAIITSGLYLGIVGYAGWLYSRDTSKYRNYRDLMFGAMRKHPGWFWLLLLLSLGGSISLVIGYYEYQLPCRYARLGFGDLSKNHCAKKVEGDIWMLDVDKQNEGEGIIRVGFGISVGALAFHVLYYIVSVCSGGADHDNAPHKS